MSKILQLELPDAIYEAFERLAQRDGQSTEQVVVEWLGIAAQALAGSPTPRSKVRQTTRPARSAENSEATGAPATTHQEPVPANALYELRLTLYESKPVIWRRLQVPGSITLLKLHRAIQILMGWVDYHLHEFKVNGVTYGQRFEDWQEADPDMLDERGVRLSRIAPTVGTRLLYNYDFGDSWHIEIVVESIKPAQAGANGVICLGGEQAGPPEDVGGIPGYAEFVKAIRNPRHPEHRSMLEWVGGSFDPQRFDVQAMNQVLKRIR